MASVTDPGRRPPGEDLVGPAFSAVDIARLTGGRLVVGSGRLVRGAAVDSRRVEPGNLFVALPGEHTDGHAFLGRAAAMGAAALVVSRPLSEGDLAALRDVAAPGELAVVQVVDPLAALQALAAGWRTRFDPFVVAVTGSVGKTTTKEAVAAVLSSRLSTLRNEGNLNNEIGLPLTVLRLRPGHEAAVFEMGMYVGGEVAELARIARPRVGVVTAVQPVHLARIGTLDAIERAKGELVEALPRDGAAVLNADDPRVARMASRARSRVRTYGFAASADVTAEAIASEGRAGMRFLLRADRARISVTTPALGRHSVHNALAAAAVGIEAGLALEDVAAGLAAGWTAPHRTELVDAGGVLLLDDTYNASPASMAAALDLLSTLPGRRVAVLGEMLELGPEHAAGHRAVGRAAVDAGVELLVVVGAGAAAIGAAARERGLDPARIVAVPDRDAALDVLRPRLVPGDVVLLKASRGAALDLLVDRLREELA